MAAWASRLLSQPGGGDGGQEGGRGEVMMMLKMMVMVLVRGGGDRDGEKMWVKLVVMEWSGGE